jgi:hypothetical protein
MKSILERVSRGDILNFEDIVVSMPGGEDRLIGSLKLTISK